MDILKKYVVFNFSKRTDKIKYIVIHDTGNKGVGADALAHFTYFNGANRDASAHYFVDDKRIVEIIEPLNSRAWHCGDGKGKYGITNDNSVGVEMCINVDGDFNKTFDKTVELTKHLMKRFNIDADHVVRHYDASRKQCPGSLFQNSYGYSWDNFKNRIKDKKTLYRVCIGSYADIENARKKAKEVGGFIVEYNK